MRGSHRNHDCPAVEHSSQVSAHVAASCYSSTVHTSSQRATSVTGTEKSGAPLYKQLSLLAIHISGRRLDNTLYQHRLSMSSAIPGGVVPDPNMILQSEGGEDFVLQGKLIPLVPL